MIRSLLAAVAVLFLCTASGASAQQAQRLTAADFSQRDAFWSASLSPDGRFIAAIQSVDQGEALVIIDWRARRSQAIQLARADRSLFLEQVAWKTNDRLVFVMRQRATMHYEGTGSRNRQDESEEFDVYRIFSVNRDGSGVTQMFESQANRLAWRDASITLVDILRGDPNHVLLGTWGQRGFTLYRGNVNTGQVQSVEDAEWETYRMIVDRTGRAVMRVDALPYNSGYRIFRRGPNERRWTVAHELRRSARSENRDFWPLGPGPNPGQIYVAARADGQEYQAIYLYDTATGALGNPVFQHQNADAGIAWINSNDNTLLVGCGVTQRLECRATDAAMQRHFDGLNTYFQSLADFALISVSQDNQLWLIQAAGPTIPATYYIYDLATAQVSIVASTQPNLPRQALAPMQIVNYAARDGAQLWGYLTLPPGAGPRATIVLPHGGPWARDSFGYDLFVQFLATRGYAVFQPNFRGSEGSGRTFLEAGFRQWGGRMQDDITDGVRHLIETGVADANRICIAGISYGGYAALAGAAQTPDLYRCAISIAGLSDLPELLESERADAGRRSALYAYLVERIGDPSSDRDALIAASPRRQVDNIRAPILLVHGERDDVALTSQSERMRDALTRAGKPVQYVGVPNAYHPWDGWTTGDLHRLLQETERFLAEHNPP